MSERMSELEAVRRRIDELDDAILALLERRAELAQDAARAKGGTQRDEDRERAIVERLKGRARRLPRRAVEEAWAAILAGCRAAQRRAQPGG